MAETEDRGKSLWVNSGYGIKFREPFVTITMPGGESVQLSLEGARHHAQAVIEAAEAATQDAFIIEWSKATLKLDDQKAAVLLNEYREWRKLRKP